MRRFIQLAVLGILVVTPMVARADDVPKCTVGREKVPKPDDADDPEVCAERAFNDWQAKEKVAAAAEAALEAKKAARETIESQIKAGSGAAGLAGQLQAALHEETSATDTAARARNEAGCAQLEYESLSDAAVALRSYGAGAAIGGAFAGGAGGAFKAGVAVTGFTRTFERGPTPYAELDAGFTFDHFRNGSDLQPVEGNAVQARARLLFGRPVAGFLIGFAGGAFIDHGVSAMLSPQIGFRMRATPTNALVLDVGFVVESRIILDGSPVTMLFGIELGLGGAIRRSDVERLAYKAP